MTEYYTTPEEAKNPTKFNTNPRYPGYFQTHFTAGDVEQFENFRNKSNPPLIDLEPPTEALPIWEKFINIPPIGVKNTFNYMFHKFKKGIFIQIRDNQVKVFLPFSKHNFTNEWSHRMTQSQKELEAFFRGYLGRDYNPSRISMDRDTWYANNGLVRYENPISENDSGAPIIAHMFRELCKEHVLPDLEFFVNRRDNPLLTRDGTEPYDYLFGKNTPLLSHSYNYYSPILSMCSGDRFADLTIPTWEDWANVMSKENIFFPKGCDRYTISDLKWEEKIPTAIFRGSSNGMEASYETNPRLKVALMSTQNLMLGDGVRLLDAGITKWNNRPRVKDGRLVSIDTCRVPLVQGMSIENQSRYKYILNIDGHVSAFRLARELSYGSCVLIVQSDFKVWYSHKLIPYVHYVPVKADLSDLYDQIIWCREHDTECSQIAQQALAFYNQYLTKDGILTWLQTFLWNLKFYVGQYQYHLPMDISLDLRVLQNRTNHDVIPFVSTLYPRSYEMMVSLEMYLTQYNPSVILQSYSNKKSNFTVYQLRGLDNYFLYKQTENFRHETYIGQGLNQLLKYIPNFSYTFGSLPNNQVVVTEYFQETQTLFEYIASDAFNFEEFIFILYQINLALWEAQQQSLFIHYDCYTWNILLKRLPEKKTYYYLNTYNSHITYIQVETDLIPILIDYEKSRISHQQHYGRLEMDFIHDTLCILINCMYEILKRTLTKQELNQLFSLSRFFSSTRFTNNQRFSTVKELKSFLNKTKKYSYISDHSKGELMGKTAYDFVLYLEEHFSIPCRRVSYPGEYPMRYGNVEHFFKVLNRREYTELELPPELELPTERELPTEEEVVVVPDIVDLFTDIYDSPLELEAIRTYYQSQNTDKYVEYRRIIDLYGQHKKPCPLRINLLLYNIYHFNKKLLTYSL
jgi:hypothetical protein